MAERADGTPFQRFGRKVDEHIHGTAPKVEEELRRVIDYLNDEVVPQVRRDSTAALRTAAGFLEKLAEQMEQRTGKAGGSDTRRG